jgi:uncharacterized protein (DUF305 family)
MILMAAAWIAGCSAPPATLPAVAPAIQPAQTAATESPYDARFIDSMIVHHQGAVDMAKDLKNNTQRPELLKLADDIIKAQEAEITQMQDWRKTWYPDLADTGGTGMSMGMMEVAAGDEPYDLRFIDAMIPHHQGAIDMAEDLKKNTQRPELLKLADDIIKAQTAEIEQMRAWRAVWSGNAAAAAQTDAVIQAPSMAMIMGSDLVIDLVKSPEAGWLVIHAADGDQPGDVLGYSAVPAGETKAVKVKVSSILPKMIAMLHVDKGAAGQYEFPGEDVPLMIDGEPVIATFSTMAH